MKKKVIGILSQVRKVQEKKLLCFFGAVGLIFVIFLFVKAPNWDGPDSVSDPKEKEELTLASWDMALKVLQTAGGLGFIATAYLAWKNYQITEDRQVSERFGQAVTMLADKQIEVRLGGIYLLERIAKDSKEDHPVVMEVLTAFIREKSVNPVSNSNPQGIQSAITVIGRRETKYDVQKLDLRNAELQGVNLERALLQRALLWDANLQRALLWKANLQDTQLLNANLQGALLWEANLRGTNLQGADLEGADLDNIRFDSSTQWPDKKEVAKAVNIPEELR